MILQFIKETETKRKNGKFYKVGFELYIDDWKWANEQIEKGNAKRIDIERKSFQEQINEANMKTIKKKREQFKKDK